MARVNDVIHFYDRRYHGSMQAAWAEGFPAKAPPWADPIEWRESAHRLAKLLGTTARVGAKKNGPNGERRITAIANSGFPLGLTGAHERDAWLRQRAELDGG